MCCACWYSNPQTCAFWKGSSIQHARSSRPRPLNRHSLNPHQPPTPTPPHPAKTKQRDVDGWRAFLGRYGISGKMQTTKISHLSEGQKSRIVFGMLCMKNYNLLLLVGLRFV
jgi:hypothetical protein